MVRYMFLIIFVLTLIIPPNSGADRVTFVKKPIPAPPPRLVLKTSWKEFHQLNDIQDPVREVKCQVALDYIKQRTGNRALPIFYAIKLHTDTNHILLMTSLIDHESRFRNVNGSAGEIGPCQIKPTTLMCLCREIRTISEAKSILADVSNNVMFSYQLLKKLGLGEKPLGSVLCQYNGSSQQQAYAEYVTNKYKALEKNAGSLRI